MSDDEADPGNAFETLARFERPGILLERAWPPTVPDTWLSQIGGRPKVPPGFLWPRITFKDGTSASLDLLAQIALRDLPEIEERKLLPEDGMLYFFVLAESGDPLVTTGHNPGA